MRRLMRITVLTIWLIVQFTGNISAQENPGNFAKMTDFLPPSPNAAAIGKFGGIAVNQNNGMANISIPLISFRSYQLALNTSLQYTSGGIKVEDIASRVGMGWSLNAGGVINRTVMGVADEYALNNNLIASPNIASRAFYDLIEPMTTANGVSGYDGQADIFSFNFNGYAGRFILDEDLNIRQIPHSNLKIEKQFFQPDWTFCITTPDGVKYYFGGDLATEKSKRVNDLNCTKNYSAFISTAWYLKSVVHPLGDQLTFAYSSWTFQYFNGRNQTHYFTPPAPACPAGDCPTLPYVDCYNDLQVQSVLLEEIQSSSHGKLKFYYASRTDCNDKKLSRIELIDSKRNAIIEAYNLTYTNYANKILYLTTVSQISSTILKGKEYQLLYHTPSTRPVINSKSQDHWGYFNNKTNSTLVPLPSDPALQIKFPLANADRSTDFNYTVCGMLTTIIYPTGGKDVITYEPNTFWNTSTLQNEVTGGVRVASISTEDGSGVAMLKKYYYEDPAFPGKSSAASVATPIYMKEFRTRKRCDTIVSWAYCTMLALHSYSLNTLFNYSSNPISYAFVIEGHGTNFQNGGILYKFQTNQDTKGQILANEEILNAPFSNTGFQNGQLLEIYEFAGLPNPSAPTHKAVKRTVNVYKVETRKASSRVNWIVNRKFPDDAPQTVVGGPTPPTDLELETIDVMRYYLDTKWMFIESTTESTYDQNGLNPVITQTNFFYDNENNLMLTRTEKNDSKGQTDNVNMTYPHDYSGDATYDAMVLRNIINPIVQFSTLETISSTTTTTSVSKTNYALVPTTNFALAANVEKKYLAGNSESEGTFDLYDDKGNLLQFTGKDGLVTSYVWGYEKRYLIARVVGATWNNVSTKIDVSAIQTISDVTELQNALENLRTLEKALVTTYTYKPLVGVSSEKDPRGNIKYFEYDPLSRLILIRDKDKNILKKICYNYYNQTEEYCNIYYSEATSKVFSRVCTPPLVGTPVTFYVPTNSFISTISAADALDQANAFADANGQAYANLMGSCGVACTAPSCTGVDKKCINGLCETGVKVYTGSTPLGGHLWDCVYHYEWSDGTWSPNYTEQSPSPCQII